MRVSAGVQVLLSVFNSSFLIAAPEPFIPPYPPPLSFLLHPIGRFSDSFTPYGSDELFVSGPLCPRFPTPPRPLITVFQ